VIMESLFAARSRLATALGMVDSETSDAVYITGVAAVYDHPHPLPVLWVLHACAPGPVPAPLSL